MIKDPRRTREDDVMARLLRSALAATRHDGSPDCPDAELVSAFYEKRLPTTERARLESHFSTCQRCQDVLAGLVRSDPLDAERPHRALISWRWLVPVAAASTAVALWLLVDLPRAKPPVVDVADEIARNAPASPSIPSSSSDRQVGERSESKAADLPADKDELLEPQRPARSKRRADSPAELDRFAKASEQAADKLAGAGQKKEQPSLVGGLETRENEVAKDRVAAAPPSTITEGAAAVAKRDTARTMAEEVQVADAPADFRSASPRQGSVVIAAPGGTVRWRLEADGAISRSTDEGRTWLRQTTGTSVALVAASAPSADICWAVGMQGVIVRTVDGAHWQPVTSATPADLIDVQATDALSAIVTSADGQRYQTVDGGQTWRAL